MSDELWWLIEKPIQDSKGNQFNQFFTGSKFQKSAWMAARFPTGEDAQFIIDEIYGPSNHNMMVGAYPVEHMWMTMLDMKVKK